MCGSCIAALVSAFALACGDEVPASAPPAPRNVVLITIDTLRADALGAYGQDLPTSANIDRLATRSVVFTQALASVPSTLPSHASILTGLQPYSHGARSNAGYVLPQQAVTLAEILKDAGYRTGAEIAAAVLNRRTQLDQGFDHYRDIDSDDVERTKGFAEGPEGLRPLELLQRPASDISRFGIRFLNRNAHRPFFLWLHYFDPHQPYTPREPFATAVPESPYHAEVAYVDSQVGRVLDAIEDRGLASRTLVVITSDHGEGLGEHGEDSHSYFVYQSTIHVPLIVAGAGLEPRRVDALVRSVDIAPTILDWLGLPAPKRMDGTSLLPLARGRETRLVGYGESSEPRSMFGLSMLRFVREGRWKYIHKVNPELYDLEADPDELHDLASSRSRVAERLESELRGLLEAASPVKGQSEVTLDAEAVAQLNALGYFAASSAPRIERQSETLEVAGQDPVLLVDALKEYAHASDHLIEKRYERAARAFASLLERFPSSSAVLVALIDATRALDRPDEQLEPLLRRGAELGLDDESLHVQLAQILRRKQTAAASTEARTLLEAVLERTPCSVNARIELVELLRDLERYREQVEVLASGVERCPDSLDFANGYAWARATLPVAELRDAALALELARRVDAATGHANPSALNTLAAAYAESGAFGEAVAAQRRAIEHLSTEELRETFGESFREQLATLEAERPIRQP